MSRHPETRNGPNPTVALPQAPRRVSAGRADGPSTVGYFFGGPPKQKPSKPTTTVGANVYRIRNGVKMGVMDAALANQKPPWYAQNAGCGPTSPPPVILGVKRSQVRILSPRV